MINARALRAQQWVSVCQGGASGAAGASGVADDMPVRHWVCTWPQWKAACWRQVRQAKQQ
eukprot:2334978-Alexandrium_andersonii.AAC.1